MGSLNPNENESENSHENDVHKEEVLNNCFIAENEHTTKIHDHLFKTESLAPKDLPNNTGHMEDFDDITMMSEIDLSQLEFNEELFDQQWAFKVHKVGTANHNLCSDQQTPPASLSFEVSFANCLFMKI